MSGITDRAIAAGKIPRLLRARLSRGETCPSCLAVGSMLRVFDAEDWAALGEATISRRMCATCGAGIIERTNDYPSILATSSRFTRTRRLFSR